MLIVLYRYGTRRASNDELQNSGEKAFNALERWKVSLPLELQFEISQPHLIPAPHVLLLQ